MARYAKKQRKALKGIVAQYRHWRSGKLMVAADYGYKGWPLR
jgi:hypothetical protein